MGIFLVFLRYLLGFSTIYLSYCQKNIELEEFGLQAHPDLLLYLLVDNLPPYLQHMS